MNKGWTIHFSNYKPSPTIFRKIQSIDIFLSVPGLHHTRWVWSNLYLHWKACWYFHHGTPAPTRPQGQKDSLCTISNQFLGLLSTKVWDGGGHNSLNYLRPPISRMPFFGDHPVCGLVHWCEHTQIHVPVPLVSVHLKVFSCEPLKSFILHLFCRWKWLISQHMLRLSSITWTGDSIAKENQFWLSFKGEEPNRVCSLFPNGGRGGYRWVWSRGWRTSYSISGRRELFNSLNNTGCPKTKIQ